VNKSGAFSLRDERRAPCTKRALPLHAHAVGPPGSNPEQLSGSVQSRPRAIVCCPILHSCSFQQCLTAVIQHPPPS